MLGLRPSQSPLGTPRRHLAVWGHPSVADRDGDRYFPAGGLAYSLSLQLRAIRHCGTGTIRQPYNARVRLQDRRRIGRRYRSARQQSSHAETWATYTMAMRDQERQSQNTQHSHASALCDAVELALSHGQLPLHPLPLNVTPATEEGLGGSHGVLPFLTEVSTVDNAVHRVITQVGVYVGNRLMELDR